MTCPSCRIAAKNPHTGHYNAWCEDCNARALANAPVTHDRITRPCDEHIEAYRKAAVVAFGALRASAMHERVLWWFKKMKGK